MKRTIIRIRKDATIEWLNPPPFEVPVVSQTKQRFSEIVPTDPVRRCAFRILRRLFGEEGKVAAWTRGWLCLWTGRILLGPHRGEEFTSPFRQAVIDWEHEKFSEPKFLGCLDGTVKFGAGFPRLIAEAEALGIFEGQRLRDLAEEIKADRQPLCQKEQQPK